MGAYIVEEPDLAVEEMYIRAFIEAKNAKTSLPPIWDSTIWTMGIREAEEAAIVSSMQTAMDEEQLSSISSPNLILPMKGMLGRRHW